MTFKKTDKTFDFETEILRQGAYIDLPATNPETMPIYLTTAFNVEDLDELMKRYKEKGFCYNRDRNPNRTALINLMNYLEDGEASICCNSGIAAISTAIMAHVKAGDHILSDKTLYGETIELLETVLGKYQVDTTFVDFTDLYAVQRSIQPNTRIFYTETLSNPLVTLPDIEAVAELAHQNESLLVVDNTFMTGYGFKPLNFGADIVVNSLTKFAGGHSDGVAGSVTGSSAVISPCLSLQILIGTQSDPFTSWIIQKGVRTLKLRVEKAYNNAEILAKALKENPCISKVRHPSLPDHPQYDLAKKQFTNGAGGIVTIELPEDRDKINDFMRKLNIAHYAMTLGGYRTTLSHPVSSSHYGMSKEALSALGITRGTMRISVGIENSDDLIEDFNQALDVFK